MDTNPFLNESSAARRPHLQAVSPHQPSGGSILRDALRSKLWIAASVRSAAAAVGGIDALEGLDAEPLPADPLCWDLVPPSEHEVVKAILTLIGEEQFLLYDGEHVVIARRILERIAMNEPELLHKAPTDRLAASVIWLVLRGNGEVHQRRGGVTANRIWGHFGVPSCTDRGRAMLRALGLPGVADWVSAWHGRPDEWLRDPGLLHSASRRTLLDERIALEARCRGELEHAARSRPVRALGNGQFQITGRQVVPSGVIASVDGSGRPTVIMMFGETVGDPEDVLALTMDDAERLVVALDSALEFDI